jgi:dienelactone hydrolase
MNEASSKYVDQIAVEKLLSEKLRRVRHVPTDAALDRDPLEDFGHVPAQPARMDMTPVRVRSGSAVEMAFPSPCPGPYEENNLVRCRLYRATEARRSLILVHGLFEDNFEIYNALLAMLAQQGCDVYMLVLPYHYHRKPIESSFSGEYLWSADLARSVRGFTQAVYDLRQLYGYVSANAGLPVGLAGFSMGAGVLLALAARLPLPGVFLINPVCNMSDLVWDSALFSTIRRDLESAGRGLAHIQAAYAAFEPLAVQHPATHGSRITIGRSVWDQINDQANYDALIQHWGLTRVIDYRAGHLNVLRAPRLAADILEAIDAGQSQGAKQREDL